MQTHDIEQGLPETVSLLDKLRMAIYRGELAPGQRLVESELAQKYDTSRGAVREALALLQNEGLVTRQRNRSAWVRPITIEEGIEILEVRGVVEGMCAAKAAANATADDHRVLRTLADEMTVAVKNGDVLTDSRVSDQVHAKIREIAGQHTAAGIIDRLRHQGVRYQFHVSLLPGRLAQGAKEHLDIIDAVIAGDAATAEQLTREHFTAVVAALRQLEQANLPPVLASSFAR
ncbi:MAG TPA: GntR family transcriptional regulator [Trebonia sp.]|nr:GntR family transcriptional regulator [Trebonia sp.]